MLVDKPYDHAVWKRLLDYYSGSTPWSRQLWRLSALLEIDELLEAWKARYNQVLSDASVKYLAQSLIARVGRDPGFGDRRARGILISHINRDLPPEGHDAQALRGIADKESDKYLQRWADEVRTSAPSAEVVSRAVGSYLLDIGFSPTSLHKWWVFHGKYAQGTVEIADLIEECCSLYQRPSVRYTVLIPAITAPPLPSSNVDNWLNATETSDWLGYWFPDLSPPRQSGALLLELDARDLFSAVEEAATHVKRLMDRFRVGARQKLEFDTHAYVIGAKEPISYMQAPRRVEVHALERSSAVFDLALPQDIDSALELLEPLDLGTPAAAIAGSWAAIESLFIGPGDAKDRVVAATRISRIVACAYIDSELKALAQAYAVVQNDEFAKNLRVANDQTRALLMEEAIRNGVVLKYKRTRHNMAFARMVELITEPSKILPKIIGQLEDAFRRLYRQRNLIVHAGDLTSVALRGTLRTAAPLIGAGIDQVVHASAIGGVRPLHLAAAAEINLGYAGQGSTRLANLLEA